MLEPTYTKPPTKPAMMAAHGSRTEQPAVMETRPPRAPLHTAMRSQTPLSLENGTVGHKEVGTTRGCFLVEEARSSVRLIDGSGSDGAYADSGVAVRVVLGEVELHIKPNQPTQSRVGARRGAANGEGRARCHRSWGVALVAEGA